MHAPSSTDILVSKCMPLPDWCVTDVLLSPDLMPHLFEPLTFKDAAVASTCSAWT